MHSASKSRKTCLSASVHVSCKRRVNPMIMVRDQFIVSTSFQPAASQPGLTCNASSPNSDADCLEKNRVASTSTDSAEHSARASLFLYRLGGTSESSAVRATGIS